MPEQTSVEETRANRPKEVGVARILVIVAVVLWLPLTGYLYTGATTGMAAVAMLLAVFGSFGAVKGRRAGRTMVAGSLGVLYFFLAPYCVLGFRDEYLNGPGYAVLDMVSVASSAVALVLLYRPATSRYLHTW